LQCEMESKEILFLKFSMMLLHKNTLGFWIRIQLMWMFSQ
jgi:hypothetical protein